MPRMFLALAAASALVTALAVPVSAKPSGWFRLPTAAER